MMAQQESNRISVLPGEPSGVSRRVMRASTHPAAYAARLAKSFHESPVIIDEIRRRHVAAAQHDDDLIVRAELAALRFGGRETTGRRRLRQILRSFQQ